MPLVRLDVVKGRSREELRVILDATHRAIVSAFRVPIRDRYQILQEHDASHLLIEDTGLGFERTEKMVVVSVTSRARTEEEKKRFYRTLCEELKASAGIESTDVMISIVSNGDADWSFGRGVAQFLTGEL